MSKKLIGLVIAALLVSTAALGGLFAQSSNTGITISASGSASGASLTTWQQGLPSWSPMVGAVSVINGGGIAHVEVPASPAGKWAISLYLDAPNELVEAYSFWNPKVQVRSLSTTNLTAGTTDTRAFVGSGGSSVQSDFTGGTQVADALNSDTFHTLSLENGFVTFTVDSQDGLGVDGDGIYQTDPGEIVYRAFEIGFSPPTGASNAGTAFTKDASDADNLSPEFTIEVKQR